MTARDDSERLQLQGEVNSHLLADRICNPLTQNHLSIIDYTLTIKPALTLYSNTSPSILLIYIHTNILTVVSHPLSGMVEELLDSTPIDSNDSTYQRQTNSNSVSEALTAR
jgi:hypothetical protein